MFTMPIIIICLMIVLIIYLFNEIYKLEIENASLYIQNNDLIEELENWVEKKSWYTVLPHKTYKKIFERYENWETQKDLAKEYWVAQATISINYRKYNESNKN